MAGPVSSQFEPGTFAPVIVINRFSANSGTSVGKAASSKSETEMESWAIAAGLGCVRGTTLALTCEAAAAVGMYAIWQLLRLLF